MGQGPRGARRRRIPSHRGRSRFFARGIFRGFRSALCTKPAKRNFVLCDDHVRWEIPDVVGRSFRTKGKVCHRPALLAEEMCMIVEIRAVAGRLPMMVHMLD